jgi:hypothetical protein
MVIVSDARRRAEYRAKLDYGAFRDIRLRQPVRRSLGEGGGYGGQVRRRVEFLAFDSLVTQYESLMTASAAEARL